MDYALDGGQLVKEDFTVARENGIPYNVAYARFYNYFWSKEKTITTPVMKPNMWKEYKEKADKTGVKQNTFYQRIHSGMDPETAATTPKIDHQYHYRKGVKITEEVVARAASYGVSKGTLKARVSHYKWDLERAITTPTDTSKRRKDLEANRIRS